MIGKALVVYGKEMRVLSRDYRLIGGMVASALVFFPLLMALASNLDRIAGDADGPVPVVAPGTDEVLRRVLDANALVRIATLDEAERADEAFVSVLREGAAYRIRAASTENAVWAAAMSVRQDLQAVQQRVVEDRMAERGLRMRDLRPFEVVLIDTTSGMGGALSLLVPYMAVILLVTNAAPRPLHRGRRKGEEHPGRAAGLHGPAARHRDRKEPGDHDVCGGGFAAAHRRDGAGGPARARARGLRRAG